MQIWWFNQIYIERETTITAQCNKARDVQKRDPAHRSCSIWPQGSMRNIFKIKLSLDQIIWNGCRSLFENIKGKLIKKSHKEKISNSSMLPWETIISPNNFPAQSIVFPKQEAVIFFSFLFFLIQIPSQSKDRDQFQCIIDDEIFISLVHLASGVCIKVS